MQIAALYARVSTKDKGQDVENQLVQLREFARTQKWTVAGEYVDHVSGKTSDRVEFRRLFEHAAQRRFDVVLFWSLDRLTREGTFATLTHLNTLSEYGVGYRSFTEQYLDTCGAFKDAVVSILATIAKQERIRLSERTVAGLERARRQGRIGGRPRLVVDRQRIRELAASGRTLRDIGLEVGCSPAFVCKMLKSA